MKKYGQNLSMSQIHLSNFLSQTFSVSGNEQKVTRNKNHFKVE